MISEYDSMAMRSATRSSLIISMRVVPSTYSEWLRVSMPSGLKFGSPPSCVMRSAIWSACAALLGVLGKLLGDRLGLSPLRHKLVAFVAQNADDFGGQRLVQDLRARSAGRPCSRR